MARSLPIRCPLTQQRAKDLRSQTTSAEQLVWSLLRDRRLGGLKFRRQFAIGPYIADFYCHDSKLIVELDGESHDFRINEDAGRTRYLKSLSIQVFRVANTEAYTNLEGVGLGILRAAGIDVTVWLTSRDRKSRKRSAPPTLTLSPSERGEWTRDYATVAR